MTHEASTLRTKQALAASLKKFMAKKPLSKITISEIVDDCNFSRKTFYYHFEDIYALLKWMLEEEAIEVVRQFDLQADFHEAVLFVMSYVRKNKHLLCCAYDSMGREEMKRFFYADLVGNMEKIVNEAEARLGLHVAEDFKHFVTHFYTEAIAGLCIYEFMDSNDHDPQKVADYFTLVVENSIPNILKSVEPQQSADI